MKELLLCLVLIFNGFSGVTDGAALPKPLSDMTATILGTKVYLAGGCDARNGSVYNDKTNSFDCSSISKSFYEFDVQNETFRILKDLPFARWRHAAAAANGKVFLHGGRRVDGATAIREIHVYDIATNQWSEFSGLDEKYMVSDHAGFSYQNYVYFAGGHLEDYTTVATTFRFNTADASPQPEEMDPMNVPRGNINMGFTQDYGVVLGGFTNANDFCDPLSDGERYDFANDSWTSTASRNRKGAEYVLVRLPLGVYAFGGESKPSNSCLEGANNISVGDRTTLLNATERYEVTNNTWTLLRQLPNITFRFAGVGYKNRFYTFGGQFKFDPTCNCRKTTDLVAVYSESAPGIFSVRFIGGGVSTPVGNTTTTTTNSTKSGAFFVAETLYALFASIVAVCFLLGM